MTDKLCVDEKYCRSAYQKIRKILKATPLVYSERYSQELKKEIYLKLDNKFFTGSFKERGALNFLLNLSVSQKKSGICAASAGNHALALSYHSRKFLTSCNIIMPIHAPLVKVRACREFKANVISKGETFYEAQAFARHYSRENGHVFAPAYDHKDVIAGQASCAYEIFDSLTEPDAIIVPIGGGGLISGIATVAKSIMPKVHILGVQSEWAYKAQRSHDDVSGALRPISIADGIAIKQIGLLTGPIIKQKVDHLVKVSESEIAEALVEFLQIEKMLIEGAAASAIAALRKNVLPKKAKKIVIVICGSNIDSGLLMRLIERDLAEHGKIFRIRVSIPDRPGSLNALTKVIAEAGSNILQIFHDRSFSKTPGNVEVTLMLESKDSAHKQDLIRQMLKRNIKVQEI